MSEEKCDGAFLEEVEARWEFDKTIDAYTFPRLLALAKQSLTKPEPMITEGARIDERNKHEGI